MRQRLAFERVLLPTPAVLLLDEPFTGLDDESAQRMVARLAALRDAGTLVVLATHDLLLVESLVDRACIVKGGVLVPLDRSLPLAESYRAAVDTSSATPSRRSGRLAERRRRPAAQPAPTAGCDTPGRTTAETSAHRHRARGVGAASPRTCASSGGRARDC